MQKRNERKNVVLLGFLKDLVAMGGNDPLSPGFGAARRDWAFDRMNKMDRMKNPEIFGTAKHTKSRTPETRATTRRPEMLESPYVVSYRGQVTHFLPIGNATGNEAAKSI
jgi:hypothetical protein